MSDTEVLEVGGDHRRGLSWQVRLLALTAALVVGLVAYVADRQARDREAASVAVCADQAAGSVDVTSRRVRAAYEYVRPSLGIGLAPDQEAGIFRVLASAASGAGDGLAPALETCTDVTVWPWHDSLQQRRDRCVELLAAHRAGLAAVADDGKALREWLALERSC